MYVFIRQNCYAVVDFSLNRKNSRALFVVFNWQPNNYYLLVLNPCFTTVHFPKQDVNKYKTQFICTR